MLPNGVIFPRYNCAEAIFFSETLMAYVHATTTGDLNNSYTEYNPSLVQQFLVGSGVKDEANFMAVCQRLHGINILKRLEAAELIWLAVEIRFALNEETGNPQMLQEIFNEKYNTASETVQKTVAEIWTM